MVHEYNFMLGLSKFVNLALETPDRLVGLS